MEAHDFKLKKGSFCSNTCDYQCFEVCLIFARKPVNINVLRSASPKPARVAANRYYVDVYYSYFNVCFKLC